jgi:hypothetical protein
MENLAIVCDSGRTIILGWAVCEYYVTFLKAFPCALYPCRDSLDHVLTAHCLNYCTSALLRTTHEKAFRMSWWVKRPVVY